MRSMMPDDETPTRGGVGTRAAIAAFFVGWLTLAWPWLSGRFTIPYDSKAQFLPQIQFLASSLWHGESPFWNPYVFSGHPQIADPQSMIFSPPFLALAAFNGAPSAWAVDATVFTAILAGGFALIVWFRDQGWHPAGAVLTALAFGFGAAMAWRIQHTGQVVSLVFLAITLCWLDRAIDRSSWRYGLAAGIAGACLVLGRDQVALLSIYLLIGFVLWRILSTREPLQNLKNSMGPLGLGALVGLAIVTVPILLTVAIAAQSNRPEIDLIGAGRGSLHPALALTLFAPDVFGSSGRMWDYWGPPSFAWQGTDLFLAQNMGQLYIGAIPALFLLIGLGSGALFRRNVIFFSAALLITTLYALGWFTPLFAIAHRFLPGVDLYRRPADAVFVMGFLAAILSGYGAHTVMTQDYTSDGQLAPRAMRRGIVTAAFVTLAAFASCLALAIAMNHVAMAFHPLIVAAALFALGATVIFDAAWLHLIRPVFASALLIGFTIIDLAISNGPGGATAARPALYDILDPNTANQTIAFLKQKTLESASATRRDRVELVALGFATPNASMTHRLENTLGYNPVRLGLYSRATGAGDTSGGQDDRKFSPLFPSYKCQFADLLGLRYIATGVALAKLDPQAASTDFALLAETPDGFIYENPRAFPRALFAASAAPADFDAILNTGKWPDDDLHHTVLLSPDDERDSGLIATRGTGEVAITAYHNTVVEIAVESSRGGYVVLNDLWHPWWNATLDGAAVPLLKANVMFRAVRVPHGSHIVRFTFAPIRNGMTLLLR